VLATPLQSWAAEAAVDQLASFERALERAGSAKRLAVTDVRTLWRWADRVTKLNEALDEQQDGDEQPHVRLVCALLNNPYTSREALNVLVDLRKKQLGRPDADLAVAIVQRRDIRRHIIDLASFDFGDDAVSSGGNPGRAGESVRP